MRREIIIPGNVISKKRGQRIIKAGKFRKILPSDAYLRWETEALQYLMLNRVEPWAGTYPCELHCHFNRKTKASFDFDNMIGSVQDMLVKGGIIEDDSCNHIIPCRPSFSHDKDDTGVVVVLKSIVPVTWHGADGF